MKQYPYYPRRMDFLITRQLLLMVSSLVVATGCSLQPMEPRIKQVSVAFDLSDEIRATESILTTIPIYQTGVPARLFTDTTVPANGFSCFYLNVVGPGIVDSSINPSQDLNSILIGLFAGRSKSYRGIIVGPIAANTLSDGTSGSLKSPQFEITIPAGPQKLIQVVGFASSTDCAPGALDPGKDGMGPGFEVGRAIVDVATDAGIVIPMSWADKTNNGSLSQVCQYLVNPDGFSCP